MRTPPAPGCSVWLVLVAWLVVLAGLPPHARRLALVLWLALHALLLIVALWPRAPRS